MGRVRLEELSDLRYVGVVCGVTLRSTSIVSCASRIRSANVSFIASSLSLTRSGNTGRGRPGRPGHRNGLIVAEIEMTSQDRRVGSRMVALALRARTPAEAQRHRCAI